MYNTKCKQKINKIPEKNSIIIFSSPSTIKCFLNNFKWDSSYKAISIGKTTAKYFPDFIKPIIYGIILNKKKEKSDKSSLF